MKSDNVRQLSHARKNRGWTTKDLEEYVKRRSAEIQRIEQEFQEPDDVSCGVQKTIEEICKDDKE